MVATVDTVGATLRYALDKSSSKFTVQAFAAGMLSAMGHSPTFAVRDFSGEAAVDPDAPAQASLNLKIRASSLHREFSRELPLLRIPRINKAVPSRPLSISNFTLMWLARATSATAFLDILESPAKWNAHSSSQSGLAVKKLNRNSEAFAISLRSLFAG